MISAISLLHIYLRIVEIQPNFVGYGKKVVFVTEKGDILFGAPVEYDILVYPQFLIILAPDIY